MLDKEATMHTDTLDNLFLEGKNDIRSVEQQISDALSRIASGASPQGLWRSLTQLLETTVHHKDRLDRLSHEMGRVVELAQVKSGGRAPIPSNYGKLTSREAEVLQLIAEGYANKQIAAELNISIKTVEKHRQHLMAKLDLHDTAGVTRYAISAGVVAASA
jgi:DNA-binding NarL/FixJ family response regulator